MREWGVGSGRIGNCSRGVINDLNCLSNGCLCICEAFTLPILRKFGRLRLRTRNYSIVTSGRRSEYSSRGNDANIIRKYPYPWISMDISIYEGRIIWTLARNCS